MWLTLGPAQTTSNIDEYSIAQLKSGASQTPLETLDVTASDLAFDASGNLWIDDVEDSTIAEYSAAQLRALKTAPSPTPVTTLTTSFEPGAGIAFDASGNLWTEANDADTLYEFSASQLLAGGAQTAAITLNVTLGPSAQDPRRLAFDRSGNLWLIAGTIFGDGAATPAIFEYAKASLAGSGTANPIASLNEPGAYRAGQTLISVTDDLAFDAAGDLWGTFDGTYFEFLPSQLDGSNPNASRVLNLFGNSATYSSASVQTVNASALAFDGTSDLFAGGNSYENSIPYEFYTATSAQYGAMPFAGIGDTGVSSTAIAVGPLVP